MEQAGAGLEVRGPQGLPERQLLACRGPSFVFIVYIYEVANVRELFLKGLPMS